MFVEKFKEGRLLKKRFDAKEDIILLILMEIFIITIIDLKISVISSVDMTRIVSSSVWECCI